MKPIPAFTLPWVPSSPWDSSAREWGPVAPPVGIDSNNYLYTYFPMPFAGNAKIQLVSQRTTDTNNISYEIRHKAFGDPFTNVGYFKTSYEHAIHTNGDGGDIIFLDTVGSGQLVGVVESMKGATSRWYLEGDERFYVDDNQSPVYYGTGTEDFYNGAWYFQNNVYNQPMSGNPTHVIESSYDKTACYRFFLQDAIGFRNHLRAGIEHGGTNDADVEVWTLAYYYYKPNPRTTLTDTLDVGNTASESAHSYVINTPTFSGSRTYTYEGDFDNVNITDDARAHRGYSQFRLAINSSNSGVILRRRIDQNVRNQKARVYVDGALAGTWYKAGGNAFS